MYSRALLLSFVLFALSAASFGQESPIRTRHGASALDSAGRKDYVWSGAPLAFGWSPATATLNIQDRIVVNDVDVLLNITHAYDQDVTVTLIAPSGRSVQLFRMCGEDGDNFVNTSLNEQALTYINYAQAPFTGSYKPLTTLHGFDSLSGEGNWRLRVEDEFPQEIDGILTGWTLTLGGLICGEVHGIVTSYQTGLPITGVTIRTVPAGDSAQTDETGRYTLVLSPGNYDLEVVGSGWCKEEVSDVQIESEDNYEYDFVMQTPQCESSVTSVNREVRPGTVDTVSIVLRNDGKCKLAFKTHSQADWLSTVPATGIVQPLDSLELKIVCDALTLAGGDYEAEILVQHNGPHSPLQIPVFLTVLSSESAGEPADAMPEKFALAGNFPNPFNVETTIVYDVPKPSAVTLDLYNLNGQRVAKVLDRTVEAGHHQLHFDASSLSTGVYFLKMTAPEFSATSKLVLLK